MFFVKVQQDLRTPPVYVVTEGQGRGDIEVEIFNPNPRLGKDIALSSVEEIDRKSLDGHPWSGLLYYPRLSAAGRRYPLVIQEYVRAGADEFSLTRFGGTFPAMGPGWSIFVAQALAARDMFVLQTGMPSDFRLDNEASTYVDGIEAIIHQLEAKSLIDASRVGLSGWSRSGLRVLFALIRSEIVFASAIVSESVDDSYMMAILEPALSAEYDRSNGAAAYGKGLEKWLENAPGFNADRIFTPLRLQSESGSGVELLAQWEVFQRLRQLNRPVEYYVVPDAEHGSHTSQNPRQILANQNGALDWHDFWFDRWILFALDWAEEASSFGGRIQDVDVAEFSSCDGAAQVSVPVFVKAGKETRSEGADGGLGPGRRRDEEAHPTLGCPQIAEQINLAFGSINKDVVRRILSKRHPRTSTGKRSRYTAIPHRCVILYTLLISRLRAIALALRVAPALSTAAACRPCPSLAPLIYVSLRADNPSTILQTERAVRPHRQPSRSLPASPPTPANARTSAPTSIQAFRTATLPPTGSAATFPRSR